FGPEYNSEMLVRCEPSSTLKCRMFEILDFLALQYNQSQVSKAFNSRETYDNAYLYILFVMLFYTFLATTLFKCFVSSDGEEKVSDEEFASTAQPSTQTFNAGHMEEKFYFEEENSL
uniref:Uncharacterized protein n=1 Tax=Gouania willdenowi TaxID=441366 RepID=A0A8C5G387_GOUWI